MNVVKFRRLPHGEGLTFGDGFVRSAVSISVPSGRAVEVSTEIDVTPPAGFRLRLTAVKELTVKHGVTVVSCDADGELRAVMMNNGSKAFSLKRGAVFATMDIDPVFLFGCTEVE
jgi:dUTPase